ncbi:MAG: response regulator transcription factor [Dehalococcoidia bacterium]|nr:response regulator transcription factor [Dehalococcoidia bacterium]
MDSQPLVLAVDDEPSVLRLVELELMVQGFRVMAACNGEEALQLIEDQRPDVAVVDVVMPRMSGLELMSHLKERLAIPVILLTAKTSAQDKVRGLEMGADDYIEKPFVPEDLSDRVHAVVRRARTGQAADTIHADGIEIDLKRRLVSREGNLVPLSRTEWMLLHHLASHSGEPVPNREILSVVWGPDYEEDVQFLRAWVARLAEKIEHDPGHPQLIRSLGDSYIFSVSAEATEPAGTARR